MLSINKNIQKLVICILTIITTFATAQAQTTQPTWWFGVSGAANFNFFDGTTQQLNNSLIVPKAFHKGFGVKPYGSILMEYRPAGIWGAMLNVAYDGRGGKFNNVVAECDCPATLKTNNSYVAIEPSLRLGVPKSGLYFFAGPRLAFNVQRDFTYTQLRQADTQDKLTNVHERILSGQVGMGYDIQISSPNSVNKVNLSPFVSFHPYFGQAPRSIESWNVTTVRAGIALKFGKGKKNNVTAIPLTAPQHDINFMVLAPKTIPAKREVSETLPLLNSVFFDEGSTKIPNRYVLLTKAQASSFKEEQLQNEQSENMHGRSARQLTVYHNILNILGDRMRSNPEITISLNGSSAKGMQDGKELAESVKQYMVSTFAIAGSRINITGSVKPLIPSEQAGAVKQVALLRAEDRRVDIGSTSPGLLMEVGGGMMKPVKIISTQVDPLDSHVIFKVDSAQELLKSWTVNVTDNTGGSKEYGPYTGNQESIPGASILGNSPTGDYKVAMVGTTRDGLTIHKQGTVHLIREDEQSKKGYRYSVIFDFDKSKTIKSYAKFLTSVVSPLIQDGSTVIIHGHTDVTGNTAYNQTLSDSRAKEAQDVLEHSLTEEGKKNVKFETFGFGDNASHSPFENVLPEERFYNRTVIIDIVLS